MVFLAVVSIGIVSGHKSAEVGSQIPFKKLTVFFGHILKDVEVLAFPDIVKKLLDVLLLLLLNQVWMILVQFPALLITEPVPIDGLVRRYLHREP